MVLGLTMTGNQVGLYTSSLLLGSTNIAGTGDTYPLQEGSHHD
jgi:hypothetical protein